MNEKREGLGARIGVDRRDIVGLVGVGLIGVGLWWVSPPLGLIVPGIILTYVAINGVKG
jgi:hypothetical protein